MWKSIAEKVRRRAPQLNMQIKSLSLDSPDATPYTLNLAKQRSEGPPPPAHDHDEMVMMMVMVVMMRMIITNFTHPFPPTEDD